MLDFELNMDVLSNVQWNCFESVNKIYFGWAERHRFCLLPANIKLNHNSSFHQQQGSSIWQNNSEIWLWTLLQKGFEKNNTLGGFTSL